MISEHNDPLSRFPQIKQAIASDGAIRLVDGRYRAGFVNTDELGLCIASGWLVVETRDGVKMAVLPA